MRKNLISLGFLTALAFSVYAQEEVVSSGSEFKPSAGNVTVEINAESPFATGAPFRLSNNNGIPSLRFRYFLNDNLAFRLNFSVDAAKYKQDLGSNQEFTFSSTGATTNSTASGSETPTQYTLTSNRFLVAIAPGLEFHKPVSERLSVYYGGYIDFAMQSAKGKIEGEPGTSSSNSTTIGGGPSNTNSSTTSSVSGEYSYEVKGQNLGSLNGLTAPENDFGFDPTTGDQLSPTFGGTNTVNNLSANGDRGFTRLGLIGVVGADYYITKGLYLGLEVSWGYTNYMFNKVTTEESVTAINNVTTENANGTLTVNPTTPENIQSGTRSSEQNKDSMWNLTPAVNAAFRFGFWF